MVEIIFREIATDTEGNIYQERGQRTMRIDGLEKGMKEKRGRKKVSFTRKKKKGKKKNTMNGELEKLLSIRIITFGTFMVITDGPLPPLYFFNLYI